MDSNQEPVGIRRAPDREAQEEKGLQPFSKVPRFGPRRLIRMFFGGFGFLLCLWQGAHGLWSLWSPGHTSTRQSSRLQTVANGSVTHVQWDEITPKEYLEYHPCYDGYQCARLSVPMDWNRTDGQGSRVAIAIIKLPAKVEVLDGRYGGAIVLNPGGPGGSGVSQILIDGRNIQSIVDSELEPSTVWFDSDGPRYFDILGFDQRGVNNTVPRFSCFTDPLTRQAWKLQSEAEGMLGSHRNSLNTNWARSEALGISCSQKEESDKNGQEWIGEFMNTAPVVADMVEIIERHGEWRQKESDRLLASLQSTHPSLPSFNNIKQRNLWKKGREKLLYWGISYGSILGTTFAAMQPHRIQRAVLDGVCDAADYYRGDWLANLQDTDIILEKFGEYCSEAGVELCPLADGTSAHAIKVTINNILIFLRNKPLAVPASSSRGPEIITYSDVKSLIKLSLYEPLERFPSMAQLLADIYHNNGSLFADYKYKGRDRVESLPPCVGNGDSSSGYCETPGDGDIDAGMSIICTDGDNIDGITREEFVEYWLTLQGQSAVLGDWWAQIRLACIRWKAIARWKYPGPVAGNTDHPMLFIGNTYDPVTPLRNAYTMASNFPNSSVLEQDSIGHCSYSSPSLCTTQTIRHYFQTGTLPLSGTKCPIDRHPFQPHNNVSPRK